MKTFSGGPTALRQTRTPRTPNLTTLNTAPDALAELHVVVVLRHLATLPAKPSVDARTRFVDDTVPVVRAASVGGPR